MAKLDKATEILLAEPVEEAYLKCIDQLVLNIAKHLGTGNAFRTANWELQKLSRIGQLTAENAKIINEAVKHVPEFIRESLEESSRIALEDIETAIEKAILAGAIEKAPTDGTLDMIQTLAKQAIDKANIVNTTMLASAEAAYTNAVMKITSKTAISASAGTETRTQAIIEAIKELSERGIYCFVDRAGREWSPEAYMNMVTRSTTHNASIEAIKARQEDYKSDIFRVSYHTGARPLCYPYQLKYYCWGSQGGTFTDGDGKRHSYKPISSTSYGKPAGLFGINCGHYPEPVIPGVTIPTKREKQSKKQDNLEYKQSQQQRAIEREIRTAKRTEAALRKAGEESAADEYHRKVLDKQEKMRMFIQETGRKRRYERESIKGV